MQYGVAIRENSMIFEFPKKIKSRITTRYRSSTPERAPNRTESRGSEDLRAPQFAAAGLTARKRAPLEGPERAAGGRRWCVPTAERGPALGGRTSQLTARHGWASRTSCSVTSASHRGTDTAGCHLREVPRGVRLPETGHRRQCRRRGRCLTGTGRPFDQAKAPGRQAARRGEGTGQRSPARRGQLRSHDVGFPQPKLLAKRKNDRRAAERQA